MRVLFIILIGFISLFGNSDEVENEIYENIITNLFPKKKVKVWTDNSKISYVFGKYSKKLVVVDKNNADIYILSYKEDIPNNKIVLTTNYKLLKEIKNSIGAFYWKKGRPNIVFIEDRLKRKHILLPSKYNDFIESERCLYELCF